MEDNAIRITHFVNPHCFYYKPVSAYVHNLEEKRFQLAVDEYCEAHFRQLTGDKEYEVLPGEAVAVLDFDRNKWCRCIVDEVLEDNGREKRYNLWAIDDGVPIQSSSCYVNPLPVKLSSDTTSKVKRGAVKNILPSEDVYDSQIDKVVSAITSHWDSHVANVIQSIIQNSTTIYFRNVTKHVINNISINFGDLDFVTRKHNELSAGHLLAQMHKACEVEPRDFIKRLPDLQTINVSRCMSLSNRKHSSVDSAKSHYERNTQERISNGYSRNDTSVNESEINEINEEDFDESASMIRPNLNNNHIRQQKVEAILENSCTEDDMYPISSSDVKAGAHTQYEKQLWHEKLRTPNHEWLANLAKTSTDRNSKLNTSSKQDSSSGNSNHEDSLDTTKLSFLSKLEMRKKMRASQKQVATNQENKLASKQPQLVQENLNIVPAGFSMANVGFDHGKVIAGGSGDSSDSSERKSKYVAPKLRNLQNTRIPDDLGSVDRTSYKRMNGHIKEDDTSIPYLPAANKVYMTKNTSRFDKVIEDEAW